MICKSCKIKQAEIGYDVCMTCTISDFYKKDKEFVRKRMELCIDFDGTMVNHEYPKVGAPVPGAIEWCKKFVSEGCDLLLWTMRSGKTLVEAVDFFDEHEIPLYGVNRNPSQILWTTSPKVYASYYIDDAAACCPLIWVEGWERPCVNWDVIGDFIMRKIQEENEFIRKLKMFDHRMLKKGVNIYTSTTPVESVPGLMSIDEGYDI
jgi:hypothetical protein